MDENARLDAALLDADRASDEAGGALRQLAPGVRRDALDRALAVLDEQRVSPGDAQTLQAATAAVRQALAASTQNPTPESSRASRPPHCPQGTHEATAAPAGGFGRLEALTDLAQHFNRSVYWVKRADRMRMVEKPLRKRHLEAHLSGGPAIGLAPIVPGTASTQAALIDLDAHKENGATWAEMTAIAGRVMRALERRGMSPFAFRSSGGRGAHIYLLWNEPQDAYSVQQLLEAALADCGLKHGTKGVKAGEAERFPKQCAVGSTSFGSMWVLPFAGKSLLLDRTTLETSDDEQLSGWPKSAPVPLVPRQAPERAVVQVPTSTTIALLRSALAAIPNEGDASLSYEEWVRVIFAVHHATSGSDEGLSLALEFSQRSEKYEEGFLEARVWPYAKDDRGGAVITANTLFALARKQGWNEDVLADFKELEPEDGNAIAEASWSLTPSGAADLPASSRFEVEKVSAFMDGPALRWRVHNVLRDAELAVVYGESGSGKSFFVFDMVCAIARDVPWRDEFKVLPGRVVYVAAEGAGGMRNRVRAYVKTHGEAAREALEANMGVIADAPNLLLKEDARLLVEQLRAFGRVDVLVVDTLAQTTPGGNESSSEDMGRALAHCKAINRATGALVLLIHHSGKDLSRGARGHSSLKAATDTEIEVSHAGSTQRAAKVTKLKDGAEGAVHLFKLAVVELGEDEDGQVIDSCVVEHVTDSRSAQDVREPAGKNTKIVWKVINDLAMLGGEETAVSAVIEGAAKEIVTDPNAKRDRRRDLAVQALGKLKEWGWVDVRNDRVLVRDRK